MNGDGEGQCRGLCKGYVGIVLGRGTGGRKKRTTYKDLPSEITAMLKHYANFVALCNRSLSTGIPCECDRLEVAIVPGAELVEVEELRKRRISCRFFDVKARRPAGQDLGQR